jgi:hypothetical protein
MKNNPTKQRKVAIQYVELCNPKQGRQKNSDYRRISMKDIADQLGTNESSLYELLEIERKLTPEIKELLDEGIITKTSASKIWVKLSGKEQLELLEELGKDKIIKLTITETQKYIDEIKKIKSEKDYLKEKL